MKDIIRGIAWILLGITGITANLWVEFYLYYKYDIEHNWMQVPFVFTAIVVAIFFIVIIILGIALIGSVIDENNSKQKENEKIS